jgi:uroporphyrin-III C-methyltransferase
MKVWLVGAGPGDPELITRKAWRILSQADVVMHDALMDVEGMKEAAPNAKWVEVGKRNGQASVEQAFICRALVGYAKQGLKVVRLKGGDPSIFGRVTEEIEICRANNIEVEMIPGVTSACAAAADLQVSLTLRGVSRSVVFATPRVGRREPANHREWLASALTAQTTVLYMAGAQAAQICSTLIEAGKPGDTPICIVESASRKGIRLKSTLTEVARDGLASYSGPVSLLIGPALALAQVENALSLSLDPTAITAANEMTSPQSCDVAFG